MLLIDRSAPFAKQLVERLAEIFSLEAAMLYERPTGEFYCIGVPGPEGFEDDLRLAALSDEPSTKGRAPYVMVGVCSGSEPVASMALRGATMPDSFCRASRTWSRSASKGHERKIWPSRSKRRGRVNS